MRIGSLCSGYGGLDMAVEQAFDAETVWHAENDVHASKVLVAHWDVPNYGDLTAIDWGVVEPVDIVTAGWPCQPWSVAGKRKGTEDERAIWPAVADAVRVLRPRIVVLENVPNIIVLGELARAVGDLAQIGYDAQWASIRASEIGAPHHRDRVFITAFADSDDAGWREQRRSVAAPPELATPERVGNPVDPLDNLLPTPSTHDATGARSPGSVKGKPFWNLNDAAVHGQWGKYEASIRRWEALTRPAPAPTEPNTKGAPRLSAAFAEWMMGLPQGWVTNVDISRGAQLRILGNGVVPQQAIAALKILSDMEVAA